jgi:sugar phosphate isomerase/epimerase
VHVPYVRIGDYMELIKEHRLNLEIFFKAEDVVSLSDRDLENLLKELDYGPVLTIHSPFMDLSPAAVDPGVRAVTHERFSQVFAAAEVLKPKSVVFHSGYEKWKYAHKVKIWLEGCLQMWPEFIRKAEALGTTIAIENIFEDTPDNLALLMKELSSERFGICFDTGHMNIFSAVPLSEWLDAIGEYIVELHLHDNMGDLDSHIPVGEGSFDFGALFGALKGRDIIRTIEVTNPEDVLKSLEALKEF